MLLGSGTKPYTAAAVFRLIEQGKVSLDDPASKHIDPVLQRLNGTTFGKLFGEKAAAVTVGHLLSMRSGIGDFDVPSYDNELLKDGSAYHSPLETLYNVAAFPGEDGCTTYDCTWVCEPGACTCYSSTNFILAGLVLLAHAPAGHDTILSYDQLAALGLAKEDYPATSFLRSGKMSAGGLSVAGSSRAYGSAEFYAQDASILGWTCGNTATSARDVARFYYALLSPESTSVVSAASRDQMSVTHTLDRGWAKGHLDYGYGLMWQNVAPRYSRSRAPPDATASYVGHAGDTYAFKSDNGYFPALKAALAVVVNQDSDFRQPSAVTCGVVQIVAKHLGLPDADQGCLPIHTPMYECRMQYGAPTCMPSFYSHGRGKRLADCTATCKSAAVDVEMT